MDVRPENVRPENVPTPPATVTVDVPERVPPEAVTVTWLDELVVIVLPLLSVTRTTGCVVRAAPETPATGSVDTTTLLAAPAVTVMLCVATVRAPDE